jgi:hypothetical protein
LWESPAPEERVSLNNAKDNAISDSVNIKALFAVSYLKSINALSRPKCGFDSR